MSFKKIQLIVILGFLASGLVACGDGSGDAGSKPTTSSSSEASVVPAVPMTMSTDATLPDYDPDHPLMVVEDNSVIHQEAIYKAWPQ